MDSLENILRSEEVTDKFLERLFEKVAFEEIVKISEEKKLKK